MTNLDSILKSRDITLTTKVCLVKAMVFPIVMYGCESWTIKKAEHQRIDAFELWCWRRLLRVPWTARRSNQSIQMKSVLNIHWKDWCWSRNSNTLTTWCEEVTHWKRPWCWEGLGAGGEGDDRGWDGWMASPTRWTWVWASSGSWWWTGKSDLLESMGSQRVRLDWVTELSVKDYWVLEFNLVLRVIFKVFLKNSTQGSSLSLRAGSPFSFLSSESHHPSSHTQKNCHTIQPFSPFESLIQKSPKAQSTYFSSCSRSPYFTYFNWLLCKLKLLFNRWIVNSMCTRNQHLSDSYLFWKFVLSKVNNIRN